MHAALCSLFFLHQSSFLEQLYECKQINFWPLPFRNSGGTETVSDCLISLWRENVQRRLCSEAAKFNRLRQISSVIIYLFILFSPPGTSVSAPKTKQSSTDLYWCQNGSEIRRSFSFSLMQNSLCVHSDPLWFSSQTHKALRHTPALAGSSARSPHSDFWQFGGWSPTTLIDRFSFTLVLNSASWHRHSRCFGSYVFTVLKMKFAEWSIGRFLQVAANNNTTLLLFLED